MSPLGESFANMLCSLQTALLETVLEEKPDGIRSHVCDIYNDIIADLFPEVGP